MNNTFLNGSQWIRADFHLHTNADKEFKYECPPEVTDSPGNYAKSYVMQLHSRSIQMGVITNHNKFDLGEFKRLKKEASKKEILILPGTELSVNDGANGIHCLIVFNERWWNGGTDFIDLFLSEVFKDTPNRENENTRCKHSLISLLSILKRYKEKGRDSFIIMAHVEDRCGFFSEFKGGRIEDLIKEKLFQEFVIGFQKVRTFDKVVTWETWFNNASVSLPVFVEGSDCKSLDTVGEPHKQTIDGEQIEKVTYIKIGCHSFDAVKFALLNHHIRVSSDNFPKDNHAHIISISFVGGKLTDKVLNLNANLNCLIGLPGSGKSSILETVRYILGYTLPKSKKNKNHNQKYKENLVEHFMESGGKGIVTLCNKQGMIYTVERTLHDSPVIKNDEGEILNMDIQDIVSFLYFGQKDLTYQNKDNFSYKFLYRFLEKDARPFEDEIKGKKEIVSEMLQELGEIEELKEKKLELEQDLNAANEKLRLYKEVIPSQKGEFAHGFSHKKLINRELQGFCIPKIS